MVKPSRQSTLLVTFEVLGAQGNRIEVEHADLSEGTIGHKQTSAEAGQLRFCAQYSGTSVQRNCAWIVQA
jgi:hypothetical protein